MTIASVSEIGKNFANSLVIKDLNRKLQEMERQVSTGKRAQTYGDLGLDASTSLSLHGQSKSLDAYASAIQNVQLRTDAMDTGMTNITTALNTVYAKMSAISQGGTPDLTIVKQAAHDALNQVMNILNTRIDGKYIFGGAQGNTPPITSLTLASTNIATEVANYQTGTSAATVITNVDAITETNLGFDTNLAAAGNVKVRADDNLNVDYTVKADEVPFKNAIKGLSMIAGIDFDSNHATDFWALFNDAKTRLSSASSAITVRQGTFGVARGQLGNLLTSHKDTQLTIGKNISNIEDADVATAASNLQNLQSQLQATYATISQVSKLSILDYLG